MEPNQDKNPEKRSVRFIEGKGFYIALVLCAAVIGVSAWSLLADTKTMDDERAHSAVLEVVPTPVVPVPETPQPTPELSPEPEIPAEEAAETAAQDVYLWPVDGAVTRAYAMTALAYDETMADWRTHDGIDIAADYGAVVSAMASGTVTQVCLAAPLVFRKSRLRSTMVFPLQVMVRRGLSVTSATVTASRFSSAT